MLWREPILICWAWLAVVGEAGKVETVADLGAVLKPASR